MTDILNILKRNNPEEKEFHQAVKNMLVSIQPVIENNPQIELHGILERLTEPERTIIFQVPWMDDRGQVHVNRGYRVEMNSAIGPYKGGTRFHPSVSLSIFKSLAFEQVFKNALTTLPIGGGRGGSDFEPKGKSDNEVMRFCRSFMTEMAHHIGPDIDVPDGGLGVGTREIGYLFGAYKRQCKEFSGVVTGKGLDWGGSPIRMEATGYGVVYFAAEMLAARDQSMEGKICLVSGSGNVAQHTVEKIIALGGKVLTMSDSSGYIFDEAGIDAGKLAFIKRLKNMSRGRISEYVDKYSEAQFTPVDFNADANPLWNHSADCAFPCAMENEINAMDADHLINNGIKLVCEGADLACVVEAAGKFNESDLLYAPSKAANAGGVAVSCIEMAQNRMLLRWSSKEVDRRLREIMKSIHQQCRDTAAEFGDSDNYVMGADIAGFRRVVDALVDQGVG